MPVARAESLRVLRLPTPASDLDVSCDVHYPLFPQVWKLALVAQRTQGDLMLTGLLCNKGSITDTTNSSVKRLIESGLVGPGVQELLSPWSWGVSLSWPVNMSTQKLSEPCILGIFMKASSYWYDQLQTQSPALFLLQRMGLELKVLSSSLAWSF